MNMDDRRGFLVQCGLALATAGLGTKFLLDAGQAVPTGSAPVAALTRERLQALLNQWMSFHDPVSGKSMIARLTELREWPRAANLEQFSLLFRGRGRSHLPEGLYRVATRSAGGFDLFIVPIGADGTGPEYRADFSLLA